MRSLVSRSRSKRPSGHTGRKKMMVLVAMTSVVSGLGEMTPGFNVEFRSFGGLPVYREQRLPDREQSRSFREARPQPSPQQQLQSLGEEAFREYRQPFSAREETRMFHVENRRGFKGDARIYREENREPFKDEPRNFGEEPRLSREEARIFKEEVRGFRDESGRFREERPFADESRSFRDGPRHFRDERPFREERRQYRDEIRPYRDEFRSFRDESKNFRNDFRHFEGARNFRDELKPFREESTPFRDERLFREDLGALKNGLRPYKEEAGPFRNEPRPFKDESGPFGNEPFKDASGPFRDEPRAFKEESGPFGSEPRPFKDESGPFRNEPRQFKGDSRPFRNEARPFREEIESFRDDRPFRDEGRQFKDEILFTQESQSLGEAHHRFSKEQEQRQPLSFGGHSNYLKFGNHGLGFASVPAAVLPLEDSSSQTASDMMRSELSQSAATQSPGTSSPREISDSKNQIPVTLAPEVGSTPSQSTSGNTIDGGTASGERKKEKLAGEASTGQASTAVTVSTSGGTSVTPKVVFGSGSASMSSPPPGITDGDGGGSQQADTASALRASKSSIREVAPTSSHFPGDTTMEVPAALLNYIFKYQMPRETKTRYVYRESLAPESFGRIQTVPLVHHHQTGKYAFLPDFKIPALSAIQQPEGPINYVSATGLPKVSYLNANSAPLALGTSYSADSVPPVNFARNLIQLDQGSQFSHLGQTQQLPLLRPIGQTEQFPQLRHLTASTNLNPLGQYGQFGQTGQPRSNNFNQGGLQLQLGGFGGIDYSALSSNSEASRASQAVSLGIAKVGLSFPEPPRPPAPAFAKVSFGESLWS